MEIRLNMGKYSSFLAVPAEVVDKHLAAASGMYVKVLLAVLRANRADTAQIAGMLSVPESEVVEAVRYWVQNGIFEEDAPQAKQAPAKSPAAKHPEVVSTVQSLTPGEIRERVEQNQDVRFLFSMAESIFGSLLTSTQQRGLIYIHETLGLPVDVIVMALQYCVSIGKGNFAYIQKLCCGWADEEINTHARAEEYIRRQTIRFLPPSIFQRCTISSTPGATGGSQPLSAPILLRRSWNRNTRIVSFPGSSPCWTACVLSERISARFVPGEISGNKNIALTIARTILSKI